MEGVPGLPGAPQDDAGLMSLRLNAKDCSVTEQAGSLDEALYLILQKITFEEGINASQ